MFYQATFAYFYSSAYPGVPIPACCDHDNCHAIARFPPYQLFEANYPTANRDYCLPGSYCMRKTPDDQCTCKACPAGTYSMAVNPAYTNINSSCTQCKYDAYTPSLGASTCTPCPKGQYRSNTYNNKCLACSGYQSLRIIGGLLKCCSLGALICHNAPDSPPAMPPPSSISKG